MAPDRVEAAGARVPAPAPVPHEAQEILEFVLQCVLAARQEADAWAAGDQRAPQAVRAALDAAVGRLASATDRG